jgi:hypothetical protein
MKDVKLLSRIKKLLALAEGGANEQESQSALLLARKMLAENGLNMAQIEPDPSGITEGHVSHGKRRNHQWGRLAVIIRKHFPIDVWWTVGDEGEKGITFCGEAQKVAIAKAVYETAKKSASRHGAKFAKAQKDKGQNPSGAKKAFIEGFLDGLSHGFDQQNQENPEWGLVLVKPQAIEDYLAQKGMVDSFANPSTAKEPNDPHARRAGRIQGEAFAHANATRPQVGGCHASNQ